MCKVHSFARDLIWTSSRPSPGPLRAIRLPDLRSAAPLLPHLHILPGARDAGKDLWPDRSKLPPARDRRNDGHGYGHGHGQAEHRAGLLGGRKHKLRSLKRNGTEWGLGWTVYTGPDTKHLFSDMYIEVYRCIHINFGAKEVFNVCQSGCFGIVFSWYHCNTRLWVMTWQRPKNQELTVISFKEYCTMHIKVVYGLLRHRLPVWQHFMRWWCTHGSGEGGGFPALYLQRQPTFSVRRFKKNKICIYIYTHTKPWGGVSLAMLY